LSAGFNVSAGSENNKISQNGVALNSCDLLFSFIACVASTQIRGTINESGDSNLIEKFAPILTARFNLWHFIYLEALESQIVHSP
jgi:hypothetical protein